jgi:hypothetical protein
MRIRDDFDDLIAALGSGETTWLAVPVRPDDRRITVVLGRGELASKSYTFRATRKRTTVLANALRRMHLHSQTGLSMRPRTAEK